MQLEYSVILFGANILVLKVDTATISDEYGRSSEIIIFISGDFQIDICDFISTER